MADYTGVPCPVCGKRFVNTDDIVVCPRCGAPYHRACFEETGDCVFQDLHSSGESWKRPAAPEAPPKREDEEADSLRCPFCGKMNHHNALFCDQCGRSLTGDPSTYQNKSAAPQRNPTDMPPQGPGFGPMPMGGFPGRSMTFTFDPLGGVQPDEAIDDIPAEEVAKLVQQNSAYYLPVVHNDRVYHRNKFNFCAFLFSGGWFLYRKQYKFGSIIMAIVAALYIAYTYLRYFVSGPILLNLYNQVGASANTDTLNSAQLQKMMGLLAERPQDLYLLMLPGFLLICILGVMIFCGLRGNRMYQKHCLRTIHSIRQKGPTTEEYNKELQEKGGVNMSIAMCMLVCYLIISWLPLFI